MLLGPNGIPVYNETGFSIKEISEALPQTGVPDELRAALQPWATANTAPSATRLGGVFERNRFLTPERVFEQMKVARMALDDDVVGGAADLTESLALQ